MLYAFEFVPSYKFQDKTVIPKIKIKTKSLYSRLVYKIQEMLSRIKSIENIDELIFCYGNRPKKDISQKAPPTPEHYNLNVFTSKTDNFQIFDEVKIQFSV